MILAARENTPSYAWTLAVVRSILAFAVFIAGRELDLWLVMYQKQETDTLRATFAAMDLELGDLSIDMVGEPEPEPEPEPAGVSQVSTVQEQEQKHTCDAFDGDHDVVLNKLHNSSN